MTTQGIEALYLETHNWGKAAGFWQALGYTVDFETDHSSGLLRNGDGPYVFIAEIPADRDTTLQVVLKAADESQPDPAAVEVVTPFEGTHFGTREMTVRDPDGRSWILQAPAKG